MSKSMLKVGVGKATIHYTEEMFPNFRENYTHVHDDSYVQVLIVEAGIRFALVACGTVMVPEGREIKVKLAELLDIAPENLILHGKHVLSAPHCDRMSVEQFIHRAEHMMHKTVSREEAEVFVYRDHLMVDAVHHAIMEAAKVASQNMKEAKMGFALGYSEANVNRVVYTNKGWWQGNNPEGVTDRTLPVLRFDDMEGNPIAILFNCNTAPGVLENSFLSDGRRAVSGDMAASAERFIDAAYENVVSIYTTGATGDQWQAQRALFDFVDRKGNQTVTDLHEQGFLLVDMLGTRLGEQVVRAADGIVTKPFAGTASLHNFVFRYPGQLVSVWENAGATTDCQFVVDGEREAGLTILAMGDLAIMFCGVEMGVRTYAAIKKRSPFAHTFLLEFANQQGGGYMVEQDLYEKMCYQSRKSRFAAGAAEKFREDIIQSLHAVYGK